jgi:hypothetical protein
MLEFILHPIQTIRSIRHIARQLTPENLAELDAAETDAERAVIETRIIRELYPDLA